MILMDIAYAELEYSESTLGVRGGFWAFVYSS